MPLTLDAPPAAELPSGSATATVVSELLGDVELPAAALYTFPAGLYGFEACRRFALVPAGREGLFWLQSAELSGLVFLLADPFHFFPHYEADLPDDELATLGVAAGARPGVLVIVTLPGSGSETASANLRAPLVLEPTSRQGRQLVLADERLAVREPLTLG
jgi:flagellar assembly factor FliW